MEHKHEVTDQDRCFYIDPAKDMAVTCEGTVKGLKRGDHGAEVYRFRMPQVIEGHDMSLCNKVEIHYNNIHKDPSTREITVNKSFAEAEGFGADQEDGDTVTWTWKPTGDATQLDGKLAFCVRFACLEGETITYQKFSGIFDAIPVGDTIHNTEEMAKEYADVLESWRQEIMAQMVTEERVMELVADKITAPAVAKVGQTIVVKAVDADGRPTEWEAADMSGGGLAEVVLETEITDNTKLSDADCAALTEAAAQKKPIIIYMLVTGIQFAFIAQYGCMGDLMMFICNFGLQTEIQILWDGAKWQAMVTNAN